MTEVEQVIAQIAVSNPVHAKKLRKNLSARDDGYIKSANKFFKEYVAFASLLGKDLSYGVECYLKMLADFTRESLSFLRTGEYSTKSFEDANLRVYNNPEVMEYYMHGLLMSQYLWVHHHDIFLFFKEHLPTYKDSIKRYLEIGAGHGMYISEAIKIIGNKATFDVVDLSPTSIKLSKSFIRNDSVNYTLSDIYKYEPSAKYDFITMGEVLEHVEQPVDLLLAVKKLLKKDGILFMTTPANAPAIDHIYLFRNAQDIREVIHKAGFKIEIEYTEYVEKVTKEVAEKMKITLMYGAYLKIKN